MTSPTIKRKIAKLTLISGRRPDMSTPLGEFIRHVRHEAELYSPLSRQHASHRRPTGRP